MPHIEGHGDPFRIRPLNEFPSVREWLAQFGLTPIETAIILGGNADATASLIDNLVAQGRIGETEVNSLVDFFTTTFPAPVSRREPISEEARGARDIGLARLFGERRQVERGRRQDILDVLAVEPQRRDTFRPPFAPSVSIPDLTPISEEFVKGLGSANLRRFASGKTFGLQSQFVSPFLTPAFRERRNRLQARLSQLQRGPEVGGFRGTAFPGKSRQIMSLQKQLELPDFAGQFRGVLERFPFLEEFMKLPPLQRGREAKRFAPRTRFLRF